jgi:hypothetical protein
MLGPSRSKYGLADDSPGIRRLSFLPRRYRILSFGSVSARLTKPFQSSSIQCSLHQERNLSPECLTAVFSP